MGCTVGMVFTGDYSNECPQMKIDIFNALCTLRFKFEYVQAQCKEDWELASFSWSRKSVGAPRKYVGYVKNTC